MIKILKNGKNLLNIFQKKMIKNIIQQIIIILVAMQEQGK